MKIIACPACGGAERPCDDDKEICRGCVEKLKSAPPASSDSEQTKQMRIALTFCFGMMILGLILSLMKK
jgi:hypothetical protein